MPDLREIRRMMENLKFRAEDAELAFRREKRKYDCSHLDGNGDWAIGLQHNFPDRLPRGICLRCNMVIHPGHWEVTNPQVAAAMVQMDAHPLYPVVRALDQADAVQAFVNDVFEAAIVSLMNFGETRYIENLDRQYGLVRGAISAQLRQDTAEWSPVQTAF